MSKTQIVVFLIVALVVLFYVGYEIDYLEEIKERKQELCEENGGELTKYGGNCFIDGEVRKIVLLGNDEMVIEK